MEENIHKGHRQRMRAKLSAHGPRVFDSYELLEMLLYRTNPRSDTNPIAKQLLRRFGSIDGVLSTSCEELASENGVGTKTASLISLVGEAYELSAESNRRCIGKTYEVLAEGFSKRSREQLCGSTEQNKTVVFDKQDYRIGDFVMVEIVDASSATLIGRPVAQ